MTDFYGSVADWCDQGFSICESYLIEAQNVYLKGNLEGFVTMAEALADSELEQETLVHINALLNGLAFCRRAGEVTVVAAENGASGLNWKRVAQLYSAMETTKGDMRMPRLDGGFERKLRAAMVLSSFSSAAMAASRSATLELTRALSRSAEKEDGEA